MAALEAQGNYEYIRLQRTTEDSVPTLTVTLQKREVPGHSLRLGIDYNSTYSSSNRSNAGIAFSLVFRSLITENSRLTINAEIMDSLALGLIILQPLGGELFVEGFLQARQDTETYCNASASSSLQQTKSIETGINLGANPVSWAEFATGVRYRWAQAVQDPIIPAGDAAESVLIGDILFSAYKLDSPIFPVTGFSLLSRYDQSLTQSGPSSMFRVLHIEGLFVPDFDDIDRASDFTHWTGALGFGARVNDGFGGVFRLGGTYRFDEELGLFIAFDLGSLGNRKKTR